ncbi:MAG: HAD family hydrolase [Bryobacteraceae bacterium]
MKRQTLIFDADDTLWENNIYFEEAFEQFFSYLKHSSMTLAEVRCVLDEIEMANARINGYGSRNYGGNLVTCLRHLAERDISDQDLEAVREFAHAILERPIQLLDGVQETVSEMAKRHDLVIFTKGDQAEQQAKIDRSGLLPYFRHAVIVKEKNIPAYAALAAEHRFIPAETWMIGNSPKSDINPSLAAGLGAVYVPHPRTWGLEQEDVPHDHPRLLKIEKISELTGYF